MTEHNARQLPAGVLDAGSAASLFASAASAGAQQAATSRQDKDDDGSRPGQPQYHVQGGESREADGQGAQPSARRSDPLFGAARVRGDECAAAASCDACDSGDEVIEVAEQKQADPAALGRGGRCRGVIT